MLITVVLIIMIFWSIAWFVALMLFVNNADQDAALLWFELPPIVAFIVLWISLLVNYLPSATPVKIQAQPPVEVDKNK